MKKESVFMYKHYGSPEKILIAASETVGISLDYISKIITDRSGGLENLNLIDVGDWCYLCSLLQLDIGCISYGYSLGPHKTRIGEALNAGKYNLPITDEVKKIWKLYKIELKKENCVEVCQLDKIVLDRNHLSGRINSETFATH